MNKVQEVFEQALQNLHPGIVAQLTQKFPNGDYRLRSTRYSYAIFVLGLECGKVVARPGFKLVEAPLEPGDLEEAIDPLELGDADPNCDHDEQPAEG